MVTGYFWNYFTFQCQSLEEEARMPGASEEAQSQSSEPEPEPELRRLGASEEVSHYHPV
jgi:hypothetical protein